MAHAASVPLPPQTFPGHRRAGVGSVALLAGCVNDLLSCREINAATIGVLTRYGIEVVVPQGAGCCGSLVHHMGRERESLTSGPRQHRRLGQQSNGLDAIVINVLGLWHHGQGLQLFMLRSDPDCAARAARIGRLPQGHFEYLADLPLDGGK